MNFIHGRFASKREALSKSAAYWNPAKTQFWQDVGIDFIIDRREGYFLYDYSGKRLIDLHLNGGNFNLGHLNPELVETLKEGLNHFDMGNHHFPSLCRTALAEALHEASPDSLIYTVYGASGSEASDIAIKSARYATGRRKIVSAFKSYHGSTGLSVCAGDERFTGRFLIARPEEFVNVPFNDLGAMERALAGGDVAAVILETIPATYGFLMPREDYLPGVKALCERHGALYIADEVQAGMMRTGEMWAAVKYGVVPDIIVVAKGIGGGIFPLGCAIMNERAGGWLKEDGFAHISTGGGSEIACVVALKVLEITQRPEVRANIRARAAQFRTGLDEIRVRHPDFFTGIRQNGLIFGLEFPRPKGANPVMRSLYRNGIWAIFSTFDPSVLQFKPGLLVDEALADEILAIMDRSIAEAHEAVRHGRETIEG